MNIVGIVTGVPGHQKCKYVRKRYRGIKSNTSINWALIFQALAAVSIFLISNIRLLVMPFICIYLLIYKIVLNF